MWLFLGRVRAWRPALWGDANGRRLPVMANLVSVLGLKPLLAKAKVGDRAGEDFELIYDRIASDNSYRDLRVAVDERVRRYFSSLRLPDEVTLYDRLLLSLRPKDLVATFNWDPFLLQAFSRNRHMRPPRVVFLHGNVYLGFCPEHKVKGYLTQACENCGQPFQPSPLLFPITRKEYRSHPLLSGEWKELAAILKHTYLLTIIGYSAPTSDIPAKEILLQAWDGNETRELAEVEVIDILGRRALHERWKDFIVRHHWSASTRFSHTLQSRYPRRSCEAFAFATLQQDPWASRPIPHFRRLDRLHGWMRPLLREEQALDNEKIPLTPFRNAR